MSVARTLVVASLLSLGWASADDRGGGPTVFTTSSCWDPNCFMTSTSFDWPNPAPYTILATLRLPAGQYVLRGKLSYWTKTATKDPAYTWGNLECFIGTPDLSQSDFSSAGVVGDEYVVDMGLPVTTRGRATTVQLGCKLWGGWYWAYWLYAPYVEVPNGDLQPIEVGVWGVRLTAEEAGRVVVQ
jgi:hypothetical protein